MEDILNRVTAVYQYVLQDGFDSSKVSYACAEIALLAFAASDDMDESRNIGDRLLQREISVCLHQIALHCVDVQVWAGEWSARYHVRQMVQHCMSVARMLAIPYDPEPDPAALQSRQADNTDLIRAPEAPLQDRQHREEYKDRIELLKIEIKALRELLAQYVLTRDNLLLVEINNLRARYQKELGALEAEAYREETNVRYLKRKYELLQASMNRQETINEQTVNDTLKEEYTAYQKVYEEYVKQAQEAAEAVRKRQNKAHESQAKAQAHSNANISTRVNPEKGTAGSKDSAEAEPQDEPATEPKEEESEEQRMKKLYRKIVKAMHPDLHPDQDERTGDLFRRANVAYEEGDLETLEEIAQTIDGEPPEDPEELLASLLKEKERLLSLIHGIREQIQLIRSRFPFNKEELLNDPIRLKAEQEKLKVRIEVAKQRAKAYQEKIDEVLKNERPDPQPE